MKAKKVLLLMALLTGGAFVASAQSYYDDDIYYDASKDTKPKQVKPKKQPVYEDYYYQNNYDPTLGGHNMPGSDAYKVSGTSTRSVDEYNRRGQYATNDTTRQSMSKDGFEYTRRIERFHNDDIVSTINDPELVDYYYSQPEVNIIINSPGYWGPSWAWNRWYSPWYWDPWDWGWGPSWAWGPSWSWSWGWGPSWAWGPSWGWGGPGWGPSWGWGGPVAWHRGDYTPNGRRPIGVRNGYTGLSHVTSGSSGNYRPGTSNNRGNGFRPGSVGNYRPGQSSHTNSRPAVTPNQQNNSNSNRFGTTTGNRNTRNSYSTPSYSSPSRGSFGGGSRGGSVGGGGGSHRGGRR